jgi:hypothetical protein
MRIVVRNPSLPVLVGWILLGQPVQKSTLPRELRAPPEPEPDRRAGLMRRFSAAWNLWKHRRNETIGLGLER